MKTVDKIISAEWVLPIAPENVVLNDHAVVIKEGRIHDLLPREWAEAKYSAEDSHHYKNHVLMPGLINAHAHTPMNLFKGLADDLSLMDWLENHIWPAEGQLINEETVETGSTLAIAEMIRYGTTCFNDHYMFPQATANAVMQTGIRACLGLQMMDVPTKWAENGAKALEKGLMIYESFKPHPRISWAWAPHAPYTTTDDTFFKLREINQSLDLPVHIHLHETLQEVNDSLDEYKRRPIERLNDLGILSPKLIAVHMTQVVESDLEIIESTGMQIVHCPESNLKLASGFAPINSLLGIGANVALGTDGAASNNDLNMFGEMQTAALLAKAQAQDPTALPADEAIKMATLNGAKAIGLDKKIGSIEAGKAADLITVNLSHYYSQPLYNIFSHLVYAISALQVENVWVDGKALLSNGQLQHIDIEHLLKKANLTVEQAKKYGNLAE